MATNNFKTIRQYINSFIESVTNKWGHTFKTLVVWVDKLPEEEILWSTPEPLEYTGYRNMEQGEWISQESPFLAVKRGTYLKGAEGYCTYNEVLYVRKDIWQNLHFGEPEAAPTYEVTTWRVRQEVKLRGSYRTETYSRTISVMSLKGDTQRSVEARLLELAYTTRRQMERELKALETTYRVDDPWGGFISHNPSLYVGDIDC